MFKMKFNEKKQKNKPKPSKTKITGWYYNNHRIRDTKCCTYSIGISTIYIGHDGSLSMADDIHLCKIHVSVILVQKSTFGFYFFL